MVDVGGKEHTKREATATGAVRMLPQTLDLILSGNAKKGDVLGVARIAGHHGREEDIRSHPAVPSARAHQGRGRDHA